jgi:Mg2+-importing ATPase
VADANTSEPRFFPTTDTLVAYWSQPIAAILDALGAQPSGLAEREARRRREMLGPNTLRPEGSTTAVSVVLRQFASPLLVILLFAVAASMASDEWLDSAIVLVIVLASVAVTASRELAAQGAAEALRRRLHTRAQVLRDGAVTNVPIEDLVPGDIVLLSPGHLVPVDGLVLSASHCFINEAPLTGESFPVEKAPGITPAESPLHRRSNCVHLGTAVQSGTATVVAVDTGRRTQMGTIAGRLALKPPETEFERGLRRFGYLLMITMLVMVIVVFVTNVLRGQPASETLLFSVALAVGLSPELLPAILSINLARDAQAMATRGVLVRRLNAIENLGSMDVLCTDKTGTLTEGVVRLDASVDITGQPTAEVMALASWNARLTGGIAGPLDAAILAAAPQDPLPEKLADIPFDSSRRRVTVVVAQDVSALMVTKGAFEAVINACSHAGGVPLDDDERHILQERYEDWGRQGIRVIGVATRAIDRRQDYVANDEDRLDFRGFLTFVDQVKADARDAIASLQALGVSIVVITGDNVHVATHVARAVGLTGAIVAGPELAGMTQLALARLAERTEVFAELDPAQKERVVTALRRGGHVVGFLGDGINDVAAMHAADTSLAVDAAVDVARQAADFVLLERGLDVIRGGIEEGRKTFANTLKYILITMSANLGNMISMAAASLVLPFLPMLASQVLLNNFLSDIPSVGLAGDRVDPELVERPRRWDVTAIARYMVRFGLLSSAFDALTFVTLLAVFRAAPSEFRTAWFVESLLTELAVALVVRTRRPIYHSRPGTVLLATSLAVAAIALALPYIPGMAVIGFVPLPLGLLAVALAITAAYVLAAEFAKRRWTTI